MEVKIGMSKKYHMLHPTISFRCRNIEEYNKIKAMVKRCGKSESDYVKEIILGAETKESHSFEEGRVQGLNKINILCPKYNEPMIIDLSAADNELKQKILGMFSTYQHKICPKKGPARQ
jgi:hypothetical protein